MSSAVEITDVAGPRRARRRLRALAGSRVDGWALLAVPLFLYLLVFFAYPTVEVLRRSLTEFVGPHTSLLDNYRWFFETPVNITVLKRTFVTAGVVTSLCLVLGYPYAYLMTLVSKRVRALMIGIVVLAGFTSYMVRSYSWLVLLQDNGPVNDLLDALGLGRAHLVGNLSGVYIALTQILLPLMILPLFATMRTIDRRLLLAAHGLGARPAAAFRRIYVPLSVPGILAGSTLVFVLTLGFYITPAIVGSPGHALYSQLIYSQISQLLAWGHAGAMSVMLLVVTAVILIVFSLVGRRWRAPTQAAGDLGLVEQEGRQRLTPGRLGLYALGALVAIWLIAPMLVVFPESLTGAKTLVFPPESWSTQWYTNLFTDPAWRDSMIRSLELGAMVSVLATILGTSAALALVRGRFPGKAAISGFVMTPMIIPLIVFAVGIYAVFLEWRLLGTFRGFLLAHLALAVPFVVVTVSAALRTFDERLEDAAMNLGASRARALFTITLPLLLPSVLTGALFAFLTSLDEIVTSLFLASPTVNTLPVQMYTSVVRDVDPTMAAAASVILVLTIAIMILGALAQRQRSRLA